MRERVRFNNPPVVEVVCGVQFSTVGSLNSVAPGLYWETIKDSFPIVEDAAPIVGTVEGTGRRLNIELELSQMPPLRRTWFLRKDRSNLIQLQDDRFLFNWKRSTENAAYPSYDVVIAAFEDHLAGFEKFVQASLGEKPVYRQFELTYVNHIDESNGLNQVGEGGVLVDHIRSTEGGRFLPKPEGFSAISTYPLPDGFGRLRVSAQIALREADGARIMRIDLTSRGISSDSGAEGRRVWFDVAHEWITHGFADITSPVLQRERWGRTS